MYACMCRHVCMYAGRYVCFGGSHEKEKVEELGKEKKIINRVG